MLKKLEILLQDLYSNLLFDYGRFDCDYIVFIWNYCREFP